MSSGALTLFVIGTVGSAIGAAIVIAVSARLRNEIGALMHTFDRAERALVPVVATVRTDRDRLEARLARFEADGSEDQLPRR
jgi:hypothetical protein